MAVNGDNIYQQGLNAPIQPAKPWPLGSYSYDREFGPVNA